MAQKSVPHADRDHDEHGDRAHDAVAARVGVHRAAESEKKEYPAEEFRVHAVVTYETVKYYASRSCARVAYAHLRPVGGCDSIHH